MSHSEALGAGCCPCLSSTLQVHAEDPHQCHIVMLPYKHKQVWTKHLSSVLRTKTNQSANCVSERSLGSGEGSGEVPREKVGRH